MIDVRHRRSAVGAGGPVLAVVVLSTLLLSGCAPSSIAAPAPAPSPGSTLAAPLPGADSPALPSGLSLVVVAVAGTGADSAAAMTGGLAAVQAFADVHGASVSVLSGDRSSDVDGLYRQALAAAPDAVVVLGPESDDALDRAAASSLAQQFLVLGGQLPEPTTNVTAVVWNGADAQAAEIAAPGGEEAAPPVADLAARTPLALEIALRAMLADRTGLVYTLG